MARLIPVLSVGFLLVACTTAGISSRGCTGAECSASGLYYLPQSRFDIIFTPSIPGEQGTLTITETAVADTSHQYRINPQHHPGTSDQISITVNNGLLSFGSESAQLNAAEIASFDIDFRTGLTGEPVEETPRSLAATRMTETPPNLSADTGSHIVRHIVTKLPARDFCLIDEMGNGSDAGDCRVLVGQSVPVYQAGCSTGVPEAATDISSCSDDNLYSYRNISEAENIWAVIRWLNEPAGPQLSTDDLIPAAGLADRWRVGHQTSDESEGPDNGSGQYIFYRMRVPRDAIVALERCPAGGEASCAPIDHPGMFALNQNRFLVFPIYTAETFALSVPGGPESSTGAD
ncbi:MAG: hypothetical protein GC188_03635 [Alphaproteobacteria bacterium]|nr:hypothetical protein [Alphaproteobacteria bacterium]